MLFVYLQITVLDALGNNHFYENIRVFDADYNNISSINKLEGSKFMDNYDLLSLRYNKIKSVSSNIYANFLNLVKHFQILKIPSITVIFYGISSNLIKSTDYIIFRLNCYWIYIYFFFFIV